MKIFCVMFLSSLNIVLPIFYTIRVAYAHAAVYPASQQENAFYAVYIIVYYYAQFTGPPSKFLKKSEFPNHFKVPLFLYATYLSSIKQRKVFRTIKKRLYPS